MKDEIFDIVDEQGNVIGQATRGEVHSNKKLIHRTVHCFVFNSKNELYLQKRAMDKDIQPGKWDTSVGGHVDAGELVKDALIREVFEELSIESLDFQFLYKYIMRSDIETELVETYKIKYDGVISPDPKEISIGRFWSFDEINESLKLNIFTPNFIEEWYKFNNILEKK